MYYGPKFWNDEKWSILIEWRFIFAIDEFYTDTDEVAEAAGPQEHEGGFKENLLYTSFKLWSNATDVNGCL